MAFVLSAPSERLMNDQTFFIYMIMDRITTVPSKSCKFVVFCSEQKSAKCLGLPPALETSHQGATQCFKPRRGTLTGCFFIRDSLQGL
ncbi:Hypothetical predicted protein [Xyrichtys novacula]|uniref:Uncharacterized protein n=1 Tax=Xyrichtys novacula TaxID=13765 RepID=A0AAV1F6I0_XYRNO|nr:Hypothetical predicted protein [Xyrichtys novacula]